MTPAQQLRLLFLICAACAAGLVGREGWELVGYKDPVHGAKVPTACAGVTEGVVVGKAYTQDECIQKTAQALVKHTAPIFSCFPSNVSERDVAYLKEMADAAYNVGVANFKSSSMCREMRAGNYRAACDAFLLWYKAGGRDCRIRSNDCYGVWVRRQEQRAACLEAIP